MVNVIINPGTGPVEGATLQNAVENMKHFVVDCADDDIRILRDESLDEGGRYGFVLIKGTRAHEVQMPGLVLASVRYMGDPQNIFAFPRLYVDGSSWVWKYAILEQNDWKEPQE